MGQSSRRPARADTAIAGLDLLLSRAGAIAGGVDGWTVPGLRAGFSARVLGGEDPLGDCCSEIHPATRTSTSARLDPRTDAGRQQ